MRHFLWTGVVLTAGLLLPPSSRTMAQTLDPNTPAAGAGQARQRGGGGFGGGQMVQGTVMSATADKITITTDASDTYTVTVTANTRVMKDRQPIKVAEVKAGDRLMAMGAVDAAAKTVAATMVMDVDAATIAKAKEDMGKTYITGKITAIDADNLKLTVMRTDNLSQVILVDEGTSFQRGMRGIAVPSIGGMGMGGMGMGGMGGGRGMGRGSPVGGGGNASAAGTPPESITLADIKVGDSIAATGALKGGVFVPVKMGVAGPGAGRRREGAPADGQIAPPTAPPLPAP